MTTLDKKLTDTEKARYFDFMYQEISGITPVSKAFKLADQHFSPPPPVKGEVYKYDTLGSLWIVEIATQWSVDLAPLDESTEAWNTPANLFHDRFTRVYPKILA